MQFLWGNEKPPVGTPIDGSPFWQGCMGFWLCNDRGGVIARDSVANKRPLTLSSATTSVSAPYGPYDGLGVNFTGGNGSALVSDYFTTSNTAYEFTVVIRFTTTSVAAATIGAMSIAPSVVSPEPYYLLARNGAVLRVLLGNLAYVNLVNMEVGTTYTVVSMYRGGNEVHFVNGLKVNDTARTIGTTTAPFTFFLATGFNGAWDGRVSFTGLWSRAMSDGEASALSLRPFDHFMPQVTYTKAVTVSVQPIAHLVTTGGWVF